VNLLSEAVRRVLVADDEKTVRDVCDRVLTAAGCLVRTAADGAAALAAFREGTADLVLTDVAMPGPFNGVRLTEEIKHMSPATDVIVMTGFPALQSAIAVLKSGAYDYLIKPFDAATLTAVVNRCFEKRRLSSELSIERRLREELQAAYAELQKVERIKESFMARVNHELRTPLLPASLAAEALEAEALTPEARRWVRTIKANLEKMQDRVENLLLFAELQKDDPSFYREAVGAGGLLKNVLRAFEPRWRERDITLSVQAPDGLPTVWAAPRLLETAFKHLLLNAVQFSPRGAEIRVEVRPDGDDVSVLFIDQGPGVPAEHQSRIFDSFYQAAAYLTREVGGLGLGLAIVRRIAEAHGGHVVQRNGMNGGSVFTLTLPCRDRETQQVMKTLRQAGN